jgi:hypothetical protein
MKQTEYFIKQDPDPDTDPVLSVQRGRIRCQSKPDRIHNNVRSCFALSSAESLLQIQVPAQVVKTGSIDLTKVTKKIFF